MVLLLSRVTCYPSWLSTNWSSKRKNIWSRTSSMESWSSIIQGLMIKQPDANSKCFKRINNQHFQKTTLFGRRGKRFCAACDTHLYQSTMAFLTASKPEIYLMSSSNWCADWNVRLEGGQQPPLLKVSPWCPNLQFLGGRWAQGARRKVQRKPDKVAEGRHDQTEVDQATHINWIPSKIPKRPRK